jgi:hypothetical protein
MTVVPRNSWTSPIFWEMEATEYGDLQIPFTQHVCLAPTRPSNSSFPSFLKLPLELQRHIVSFCDSSTLFQLTQVCLFLRKEALDLFWSDPTVWYIINGHWILAGCHTGHTNYSVDALKHIKQVVVRFDVRDPLSHGLWHNGNHVFLEDVTEEHRNTCIRTFWRLLQQQLPNTIRVVLSERFPSRGSASLPLDLQEMAEGGPRTLFLGISIAEAEKSSTRRLKRVLWEIQRQDCADQSLLWHLTASPWIQMTVAPPLKQFRGPVGAYSQYLHKQAKWVLQTRARRLLELQATEKYLLQQNKPTFTCCCNIAFDAPGQWTAHAIETNHDAYIDLPSAELEALFTQHDERLALLKNQFDDALLTMRVAWENENSVQRQQAEEKFLTQLQEDPLYARRKDAASTTLWQRYCCDMNGETYYG